MIQRCQKVGAVIDILTFRTEYSSSRQQYGIDIYYPATVQTLSEISNYFMSALCARISSIVIFAVWGHPQTPANLENMD